VKKDQEPAVTARIADIELDVVDPDAHRAVG
jgi:hypothetical protein